jgi:hypothetical protein
VIADTADWMHHYPYSTVAILALALYQLLFVLAPRARDTGISGSWVLLSLFPVVYIFLFLILIFRAPEYHFESSANEIPWNMDPQVPQPPPIERKVSIGPIIRDTAIVVVLRTVGGFIYLAGPFGTQRGILAAVASNSLLGTIGFVISGCLSRGNRWRHLGFVALGVWLFNLVSVAVREITIPQWIFGSITIAMMMAIGGALSYMFRRDDFPS